MKTPFKKATFALLALCPAFVLAQDPETDDTNDEAPAAPAMDPVEEYTQLLRDQIALDNYNELLETQIRAQEADLVDMETTIEQIPDFERQLPPLLLTMVEQLDEFIEADVPFLLDERRDRLANLQTIVENANISDAEKLRRIFEAWSIEVEYGGAFQTERTEATLPDGTTREADFLMLGRVGLIYQTIDEEGVMAAYDIRTGEWQPLGSEYRSSVLQALRMGRNQIAPELVLLPIAPPQPD
jgi:hypothetical protein